MKSTYLSVSALWALAVVGCSSSAPPPSSMPIGAVVTQDQALKIVETGQRVGPKDFVKVLESTPPPLRPQLLRQSGALMSHLSDSDRAKAQQLLAEARTAGGSN